MNLLDRDEVLRVLFPGRLMSPGSYYRLFTEGTRVRGYPEPVRLRGTQMPGRLMVTEADLVAFLVELERARELARMNGEARRAGADAVAVRMDGRSRAARAAGARASARVEAGLRSRGGMSGGVRSGEAKGAHPPVEAGRGPGLARLRFDGREVAGRDGEGRVPEAGDQRAGRLAAEVVGRRLDVVG